MVRVARAAMTVDLGVTTAVRAGTIVVPAGMTAARATRTPLVQRPASGSTGAGRFLVRKIALFRRSSIQGMNGNSTTAA